MHFLAATSARMYGPSDRPIQRPEIILGHLTPYTGPVDMGPTSGSCGTRCGPTGPKVGPTVCGSTKSIICGAYYSFPKKTLNSDKINLHSTYAAPHKILRTSVKSICTSRTTNPHKTPQYFCKTNPLNMYR